MVVTGLAQWASNPAAFAASTSPIWAYRSVQSARSARVRLPEPARKLVTVHPREADVEDADIGTESVAIAIASGPFPATATA